MTDTAAGTPSDRSLTIMLWIVVTGFFMQTLDSTIVNTALPAMARSLGEAPLRMQGVVITYSLTMAMMIPVSGWLPDKLGTHRVFLSAILIFTIGSLLCTTAQSLTALVAFRVVQGAAARCCCRSAGSPCCACFPSSGICRRPPSSRFRG